MRIFRGGQSGVGNFLESISIFGKIIFFTSFISTLISFWLFIDNDWDFIPYFSIIVSLGISFGVTFIFELIYQLFRNK